MRDALHGLTPAEHLVGFTEAVDGLAQKIDLIVAQKDPATLQQLEAAITTLRGMAGNVASNETVSRLAAEVQSLADKVEQIGHGAVGDVRSTIWKAASTRSPTRWPNGRRPAIRCRRGWKRWCSR